MAFSQHVVLSVFTIEISPANGRAVGSNSCAGSRCCVLRLFQNENRLIAHRTSAAIVSRAITNYASEIKKTADGRRSSPGRQARKKKHVVAQRPFQTDG